MNEIIDINDKKRLPDTISEEDLFQDDVELINTAFRTLWCEMASVTEPRDWENAEEISIKIQVPEVVRPILKVFADILEDNSDDFESFVFSELVKVGFCEKANKAFDELEEGKSVVSIERCKFFKQKQKFKIVKDLSLQQTEKPSALQKSDSKEMSPHLEKILEDSEEMPHPGGAKVTIFPNPREGARKYENRELPEYLKDR